MPVDPLDDALQSLLAAGLDADTCRRVLRVVRKRWVGQCYVRSRDPGIDEVIRAGIEAGETSERVARRAGVSISTIKRRRSKWLR